MTSHYERVVCGHGAHKWVLKEKGAEFVEDLDTLKNVAVCPGCLKGGGDDTCRMRECTKERGLVHCDECDAGEKCPHVKSIEYMREAGKAAGMIALIRLEERTGLINDERNSYFKKYPGLFLVMKDE